MQAKQEDSNRKAAQSDNDSDEQLEQSIRIHSVQESSLIRVEHGDVCGILTFEHDAQKQELEQALEDLAQESKHTLKVGGNYE